MTVWLVNPFDNLPTEGCRPQRYWLMARAFVRAGHEVVYWTSDFSHATKRRRIAVDGSRSEPGIEVVQIPTLPYGRNVCLARILSHRRLAHDFERLAASYPSPGIVVASVPPLGLCAAAMRLAKTRKVRFICDIQDAWPETFERILPRFIWSMLGARSLARNIYCGADAASAVAGRYLELAESRGCVAPMKAFGHCIEGGFRGCRDLRGGVLRLVYAGNMSLSYDLKTVMAAVARRRDVTLDIAGNGPDLPDLRRLADSLHAENVKFHGYLGEADLAGLLSDCDVGLVPMFPDSCVGVPGKLADYALAGLRIVESLGGETTELVCRYEVGVSYEARSVESFLAALDRVRDLPVRDLDAERFASVFDARAVMDSYVAWATEGVAK